MFTASTTQQNGEKKGGNGPAIGRERLEELCSEFTATVRLSESSRRTYGKYLGRFKRWTVEAEKDPGLLTEDDIRTYKSMLEKEYDTDTVSSYMSALRRYYRWIAESGHGEDIARKVKTGKKRDDNRRREHITEIESLDLQHATCQPWMQNADRNYAIVKLIAETGIMTRELTALNIADLKDRGGRKVLCLWGRKSGDRDWEIVLPDHVAAPISRYLESRLGEDAEDISRRSEPLFTTNGNKPSQRGLRMSERSVQMIVKDGLRAIGSEYGRFSTHSLRRCAAIQVVKAGGDDRAIQRALRLKSSETSRKYYEELLNTEGSLRRK